MVLNKATPHVVSQRHPGILKIKRGEQNKKKMFSKSDQDMQDDSEKTRFFNISV